MVRPTPRRRTRAPRALAAVVLTATLGLAACSDGGEPKPTPSTAASSSRSEAPIDRDRPSKLAWDSGVVGHDAAESAAFASTRGHANDVIGVSPTRDSWEALFGDWWLEPSTIPKDFKGTLNVAMPLFPDDGSMEAAAAGKDNAQWRRFGAMLAKRYPDAYVRPGWEMNIHNWKWSANPGNVEQYKKAFQNASRSLKEGGPNLRIVWNVNEGKGDTLPDASMAWPGDEYVDIVGMDAYDWSPPYDEKGWEEHKTKDQGWDYWGNFARQHGKKFALPEWGVIAGNEGSGGDNPFFVEKAYAWMEGNSDIMAFETYFDERQDYCRCSLEQNPKAKAKYLEWMKKLA